MQFFSSEEHAKEWAQKHPELDSDLITMEQGLALATAFHGSKMDYDWEPDRQNLVQKLAQFGLDRDFWKIG